MGQIERLLKSSSSKRQKIRRKAADVAPREPREDDDALMDVSSLKRVVLDTDLMEENRILTPTSMSPATTARRHRHVPERGQDAYGDQPGHEHGS